MCNCNTDPCKETVYVNSCNSCTSTLNTDCVIYNKEKLDYEPITVQDNQTRTLTSVLQSLEDNVKFDRDTKIIEGNYTILPEDADKILLLKGFTDSGSPSTVIYTLTLPVNGSVDFINKELIFKNITPAPFGTDVRWQFNIAIQFDFLNVLDSIEYNTLQYPDVHRNLKLRFIKTTATNYQWVVM